MQIIILEETEVAPFSGQFFTDDSAACVASQIDLCKEAARAEMVRRQAICNVNLGTFREVMELEMSARDEIILLLEDELADALIEPWYESFTFRVSLGFVVGVGAGYLVHELVN